MASLGNAEEANVVMQTAAERKGRDGRIDPPAPRLTPAEVSAYTAANLYALMAWLYVKPQN